MMRANKEAQGLTDDTTIATTSSVSRSRLSTDFANAGEDPPHLKRWPESLQRGPSPRGNSDVKTSVFRRSLAEPRPLAAYKAPNLLGGGVGSAGRGRSGSPPLHRGLSAPSSPNRSDPGAASGMSGVDGDTVPESF